MRNLTSRRTHAFSQRTLPLYTPTTIELDDKKRVKLTLFDANHCPGAVMYARVSPSLVPLYSTQAALLDRFLIEGDEGAVLHTGDFRAEPWFLQSLIKNPFLQKYLAPPPSCSEARRTPEDVLHTLKAIYLDTACLFSTLHVPTKVAACFLSLSGNKIHRNIYRTRRRRDSWS